VSAFPFFLVNHLGIPILRYVLFVKEHLVLRVITSTNGSLARTGLRSARKLVAARATIEYRSVPKGRYTPSE